MKANDWRYTTTLNVKFTCLKCLAKHDVTVVVQNTISEISVMCPNCKYLNRITEGD